MQRDVEGIRIACVSRLTVSHTWCCDRSAVHYCFDNAFLMQPRHDFLSCLAGANTGLTDLYIILY
jgi:hypothetical protein